MDVDVLAALKEDEYRWGDLQAIRYDKSKTGLFPDKYLAYLYNRCRESKRRTGDGILSAVFGGNPASDFNSIVTYLAQRPLVILGQWVDGKLCELGFAFSIIVCGGAETEKAIFAGYGFFKQAWGRPEQTMLTMLGLAYLFKEFDLRAIHGIRYKENLLTARFMEKFGFRQVGEIPHYQLRGKELVPGVVSTLLRADFIGYAEQFLVEQYRAEQIETEDHSGEYMISIPEEYVPTGRELIIEPEKPQEPPYVPLNWL